MEAPNLADGLNRIMKHKYSACMHACFTDLEIRQRNTYIAKYSNIYLVSVHQVLLEAAAVLSDFII